MFGNGEKMLIAIQHLAARAAGVDIVYHGADNPNNQNYSEKDIKAVIAQIDAYIASGDTPGTILKKLLALSMTDRSWGPKI